MPFTRAALHAAQGKKRALLEKDYELQQVRSRRRVNGQDEYLCVWKGYGPDGDTWEPKENLGEHFGKAAALNKKVEVQLDRHRYLFQEAVAKQLTSKKIKDKTACYLPLAKH